MKNKLLNAFVIALILFQAVAPIGVLAYTSTDQADYAPGSVVTIFGDNGDGAGYIGGETVHVDVRGPNGYIASCDAFADDTGAWSCQVTLWTSDLAVGSYSYSATGQTSGVSQSGNFTDAKSTRIQTSSMSPSSGSCGSNITVSATLEGKDTPQSSFKPLSGKTVSFTLGSSTGSGTTDASGIATASLTVPSGATALVASFAADSTYNAVSSSITFVVTGSCTSPSTTTVTVSDAVYDGNPHGGAAVVTGSGGLDQSLPVTYTGRLSTAYGPSTTAPTNVGDYTASASFPGDAAHSSSSDSKPYSITKASSATTVTGGTFAYDGNAHPATVSVTGAGGLSLNPVPLYSGSCSAAPVNVTDTPCTASYTYAGDANHTDSSGSDTITINQATSVTTVTFEAGPYTYRGGAFTATAIVTGNGGLNQSVSVSYSGDCTNVTSANGCTATATFAGDANHGSSSDSKSITIDKADQAITFGALNDKTFGDADFGVSATASSGLGVSFAAAGSCTVSGNTVHITGAGNCTITASQGGNGNYNAAPDVLRTFNIAKANQTIIFDPLGGKTYGDADFDVSATASSGLAVSFSATGNCTVSGNMVHITGAGSCAVTASQTGNDNYNPAPDVPQSFNIAKATPTVNVTGGTFTYDANAHPATGSVTGVFGEDLGTPTFTYNGSSSSPVNANTYNVVASFAGNENYKPAFNTAIITINPATPTVIVSGGPFTYDGASHGAGAQAKGVGDVAVLGNFSFTYDGVATEPTNAGTYAVVATFTSSDTNYTNATGNGSITINKAASYTAISCPAYVTYNGSAQTPCTVAVTGAGGLNLAPNAEYLDNSNAGVATASYTYGGDANHDGSSDSKTFEIKKAPVTATAGSGLVTYDGSAKSPSACALTGAYTGDLTCANSPASVGPDAGTTTIVPVVSGTGLNNFAVTSVNGSYTINKAPSTTVVTCPASVYFTGSAQTPCSATVTGAGGLSQLLTVNYSSNTAVGTATASASYLGDTNHNGSSDSKTFQILAWTLTGFYQPVDMTANIWNTVKGGSTVPLKFNIYAGSVGQNEQTSTSAVKSFSVATMGCGSFVGTEDPVDFTTTGGTSLRYDTTAKQFVQNWQTPKGAGICYKVTMTTLDLSTIIAYFKTK